MKKVGGPQTKVEGPHVARDPHFQFYPELLTNIQKKIK